MSFDAKKIDVFQALLREVKETKRKAPLLFLLGFNIIMNELDLELLWQLLIDVLIYGLVVFICDYSLSGVELFRQVKTVNGE